MTGQYTGNLDTMVKQRLHRRRPLTKDTNLNTKEPATSSRRANMIQGSLFPDKETEDNRTMVPPGMHKHIQT